MNRAIRRFGPDYPWGFARQLFASAHLRVINLETVIAKGGQRGEKFINFRAHPIAIETLKLAGIDCVCLANNHVLDYGAAALLEMLERLTEANIAFAGAGRNLAQARQAAMLNAQDLRVGLVAFTDNEPGWAATATTTGINWIDISRPSLAIARDAIARMRAAGAQLIIFSNHWGGNLVERPCQSFREFARAVIDSGADIYFGHSAHIFQGIEIYQGRPIIYDAGDFINGCSIDPKLRKFVNRHMPDTLRALIENDALDAELKRARCLLYQVNLNASGNHRLELIPVIINDCQAQAPSAREFELMAKRIAKLSAELGATINNANGKLWIDFQLS
jgi:poly-gamma-glutamate synthesis protein (capsule biosynthesis protein)